jgi:hypothetical protein
LSAFGCCARRDPVINGSAIACVEKVTIRVLLFFLLYPFSFLHVHLVIADPRARRSVLIFRHVLFLLFLGLRHRF